MCLYVSQVEQQSLFNINKLKTFSIYLDRERGYYLSTSLKQEKKKNQMKDGRKEAELSVNIRELNTPAQMPVFLDTQVDRLTYHFLLWGKKKIVPFYAYI